MYSFASESSIDLPVHGLDVFRARLARMRALARFGGSAVHVCSPESTGQAPREAFLIQVGKYGKSCDEGRAAGNTPA